MLTDKQIQNAKPKDKLYRLADGLGLYVEVTPTGSKLWRLKYRIAGREKRLAFGVYPTVSSKQARKQLSQGIDPSEQRQVAKQGPTALKPWLMNGWNCKPRNSPRSR